MQFSLFFFLTFQYFVDVGSVEVDSMVIIQRAVSIGDTVLCDVHRNVVKVVFDPV